MHGMTDYSDSDQLESMHHRKLKLEATNIWGPLASSSYQQPHPDRAGVTHSIYPEQEYPPTTGLTGSRNQAQPCVLSAAPEIFKQSPGQVLSGPNAVLIQCSIGNWYFQPVMVR